MCGSAKKNEELFLQKECGHFVSTNTLFFYLYLSVIVAADIAFVDGANA